MVHIMLAFCQKAGPAETSSIYPKATWPVNKNMLIFAYVEYEATLDVCFGMDYHALQLLHLSNDAAVGASA
jgi:hypothetical protein